MLKLKRISQLEHLDILTVSLARFEYLRKLSRRCPVVAASE